LTERTRIACGRKTKRRREKRRKEEIKKRE
jgi:hypothetical protein